MTAWSNARALAVCAIVLFVGGLAVGEPARAQDAAGEFEVKAAFLYNFAKFVEWPAAAFSRPDAPLTLCVWGADPFVRALDVVQGKPVKTRTMSVVRQVAPDRAGDCSMVFISTPDGAAARAAVQSLRGRPVLTVGDAPGFAAAGGVIGFVVAEGRVRFQINPKAAARAGLTLSSQLLRLATIVEEG